MKVSTLIKRLKNKSGKEIFVITFYKILLYFQMLYDRVFLAFSVKIIRERAVDSNYYYSLFKDIRSNVIDNFNFGELLKKDSEYSKYCKNRGNDIIKGKIWLFDKVYNIPKYSWHIDPLTGNSWKKNIFFSKYNVEQENLADVKYILEYNKLHHLINLAVSYYFTNEIRFYSELKKQIVSWVHENPINVGINWKIKLDLSFRNINLLTISLFMWDLDRFRSELFPLIIGIIDENVKQLNRYSTIKWFRSHKGGNHIIGELVGILIPMLVIKELYDDHRFKILTSHLDNALIETISEDGVYLEQSACYSKLVTEFLVFYDIIMFIFNKETSLIFKEKLKKMILYLNEIQEDSNLPDFGDCDGAKLYYTYKEYFNISHILWYGNRKKYSLFNYSQSKELKMLNKIGFINKKSRIFDSKEGGQFVFKSIDDKNVYIFVRYGLHSYGEPGKGSHAHNDLLSIILSIKGIPIFIDKGTLLYNSGVSKRNLYRGTCAHNTISIIDVEQAPFLNKWAYSSYPEFENFNNKISGNLIFKSEINYGGVNHIRSISYKNNIIDIKDSILFRKNSKGKISFLINPDLILKKSKENEVELYTSNNEFLCVVLLNDVENMEVINDVYYPLYSRNRGTKRIQGEFDVKAGKDKTLQTKIII